MIANARPRAPGQRRARGCCMRTTLGVSQHDTRAFLRHLQAWMRHERGLGGLLSVFRTTGTATYAMHAKAHDGDLRRENA
jgi:hypothetical protein